MSKLQVTSQPQSTSPSVARDNAPLPDAAPAAPEQDATLIRLEPEATPVAPSAHASTATTSTTTTTLAYAVEHTTTLSPQAETVRRVNQEDRVNLGLAIKRGDLEGVKTALAEGKDAVLLLHIWGNGASALHVAVRAGQPDVVAFLLGLGADKVDVNAADAQGTTALHDAAEGGHVEIAIQLLAAGARSDAVAAGRDNTTPLLLALSHQKKEMAELFLKSEQIGLHRTLKSGATPFYLAIEHGWLDIADNLRVRGADMEKAMSNDWTPVLKACFDGEPETVRWLAKSGANLEKCYSDKDWSCVMVAAMNIRSLEQLMNRFQMDPRIPRPVRSGYRGLNITLVGAGGDTYIGLNKGAFDLWLQDSATYLQTGVKGDALQRMSVQALHTICWDGERLVCRSRAALEADRLSGLTQTETIRVKSQLLFLYACEGRVGEVQALVDEHGVDPNVQNEVGFTPLRLASAQGLVGVVRFLANHEGVRIDQACNKGWTPLLVASNAGYVDVVACLLESGADTELENLHGRTPLWVACQGNHLHVVDQLLEHDAVVDWPDNGGWSPLHVACHQGHGEVVELLLGHSADESLLSHDGETPLQLAQKGGHHKIVKMLGGSSETHQ